MRRRHMTTATAARFLVEAPKPANIEVEVLDLFDARWKLQDAINQQELKRKEAELELASSFARETHNKAIDGEAAFQKSEAWRVADERAELRIAALSNISSKVDGLIARHKAENTEAVKAALTKKLNELIKALEEKNDAANDLAAERKRIEQEIAKLPKISDDYGSAAATSTTGTRSKKR